MKAFQLIRHLVDRGVDVIAITHERNRAELEEAFPAESLVFVSDGLLQRLAWTSRIFRFAVTPLFHLAVLRILRGFDPRTTTLHFVTPISPVQPRFYPKDFRTVIGPLNGNIYAPPGFEHRLSRLRRVVPALHIAGQRLMGLILPDKARATQVLNSGGARTRASLVAARVDPARIVDVADSGVGDSFAGEPPLRHAGRNTEFVCVARLMKWKGVDLALRALSRMPSDYRLTVVGDGPERGALWELAAALGIMDRVRFTGYLPQSEVTGILKQKRALLFPSVAEANGIAIQEAMVLGLPVIALDWGGPADLLADGAGILIEPQSEDHVVDRLAAAMERLAEDGAVADAISGRARQKALDQYGWDTVAASWGGLYAGAFEEARARPAAPPRLGPALDAGAA